MSMRKQHKPPPNRQLQYKDNMKNKFNAGDKVIWIELNERFKHYEVFPSTIETVCLNIDSVEYYLKDGGDATKEQHLYTKEEAIKFLKEVLV